MKIITTLILSTFIINFSANSKCLSNKQYWAKRKKLYDAYSMKANLCVNEVIGDQSVEYLTFKAAMPKTTLKSDWRKFWSEYKQFLNRGLVDLKKELAVAQTNYNKCVDVYSGDRKVQGEAKNISQLCYRSALGANLKYNGISFNGKTKYTAKQAEACVYRYTHKCVSLTINDYLNLTKKVVRFQKLIKLAKAVNLRKPRRNIANFLNKIRAPYTVYYKTCSKIISAKILEAKLKLIYERNNCKK